MPPFSFSSRFFFILVLHSFSYSVGKMKSTRLLCGDDKSKDQKNLQIKLRVVFSIRHRPPPLNKYYKHHYKVPHLSKYSR